MSEQEDNFVKVAMAAIDRATLPLTPTMNLRWLKLEAWEIGGQKATPIFPLCHKLQQEWFDQTGQSIWCDIPIAEEEPITQKI